LHIGLLKRRNILPVGQNTDFTAVNVAAIKKYSQKRGVSVNDYLKPGLVEMAVAVKKIVTHRSQRQSK